MKTETNKQWTTYRILDATIGYADMASPFNWGSDGAGHDVKLFGATTGAYLLWDEANDQLVTSKATIRMGTDDHLEFTDANNYIYNTGDGQLILRASYGGVAIILDPTDAAGWIQCQKSLVLANLASTSSTHEGAIWFDTTDDKIHLYGGSAERIIISSDSSGDIVTVGHLTIPSNKYLYFGDTSNSIYNTGDGQLILTASYGGVAIILDPTDAAGWIQCQKSLVLANLASTSSTHEGAIWFDTTDDKIHLYGGSAERIIISSDSLGNVLIVNNLTLTGGNYLYLDGTSNYIYGTGDDQIVIAAAYAGPAILLNPSGGDSSYIHCGAKLKLHLSDVDSAVEGMVWYDDSENKIKFYNGTAVRTLISSDSLGDITTVGHVTIPANKYLYFANTNNYIYNTGDDQIIIKAAYAGLAIYLDPTDAAGFVQVGGCLVLAVLASGITTQGATWFDTTDNKIHFYDGTQECTVTSSP